MSERFKNVKDQWRVLKTKSGFRDTMLFLVFVCVSAVFWLILALNDSAQDHFNVKLNIVNQPDSITFISDVPEKIGVTISDKGTTLWRNGYLKKPSINIDFKEYSSDGILKYSYSDLISSMKEAFGSTAQITSLSLDSLQLFYTHSKGKKVPVLVRCQVYPASGSTMDGDIKATPGSVYIYGNPEVTDTIKYVSTEDVILRDLSETTTLEVKITKLKGARALPSKVTLTVPIEPLVKREAMITVDAINVPPGEDLLLFPSKIPVEYFVAMSRLSDDEDNNIELTVDFNDISLSSGGKLKVSTKRYPERLKNLKLKADSVEYAIVRD